MLMTKDTIDEDDMEVIPSADCGTQDSKLGLMFSQLYNEENTQNVGLIATQHWAENQIILDSGANASVFKNQNLLWNLKDADIPLVLNGVQEGSKPIICDTVADSDFGFVHISDKAIANLLALSDVRDRAVMMYFNMDDDRFEVQMHCNGPIYFF
jgi:hypothetical protein